MNTCVVRIGNSRGIRFPSLSSGRLDLRMTLNSWFAGVLSACAKRDKDRRLDTPVPARFEEDKWES